MNHVAKPHDGCRNKSGMTVWALGLTLLWSPAALARKPVAQPSAQAPAETRAPITIPTSIDGFRADCLANGPAIRPAGVLPGFDNVDIAPLVRDLIGLPPGVGLDGDDRPFRDVLVK